MLEAIIWVYCKNMQNLENLDVFEIFDNTKTAKMPEGPFCQIRTQILVIKAGIHKMLVWIANGRPLSGSALFV